MEVRRVDLANWAFWTSPKFTTGVNIIRVFWPKAGLSLQMQETRLQFCPKAGLPLQIQEPRLKFY